MTPVPINTTRGNTLLMVLITIAVLSLIAGNLMWSANARYHVTYQSASWQEALVAAEAGVDVAMSELRKRVISPADAFPAATWRTGNAAATYRSARPNVRAFLGGAVDPTALPPSFNNQVNPSLAIFPDNGRALPLTIMPSHGGEGNTSLAYRVYVDVPDSDAVNGGAIPATANNTLAQPPPGSHPADLALQFLNQSDDSSGTDSQSRYWWRIRSVGYAGVSGPPRPSPDRRDNLLRRFSFFTDWRNGAPSVVTVSGVPVPAPNVSRVVEVLVQPRTRTHFALLGDTQIDLAGQSVLVDSYDSTKGDYATAITVPPASDSSPGYTAVGSATGPDGSANPNQGKNVGWMGNVATNGQLINAGGANVQGDAMTNDGQVDQAQNVTGAQDPNFFQDLTPIKAINWSNPPAEWAGVPNTSTVNSSQTLYAGASPTAPAHLRVNGIDLTNGAAVVNVLPPANSAAGTPGFIKIYVDGDLRTNGTNAIVLDPNVSATIYVTGSVNLAGTGIDNQSALPSHLVLNGIKPVDGTVGGVNHQITITPTAKAGKKGPGPGGKDDGKGGATAVPYVGDFTGIIYAPQHDLLISGSQNGTTTYFDYAGSFIANKVRVNVNTQIHYDESLRNAGHLGGYKVVNWFEDTLTSVR